MRRTRVKSMLGRSPRNIGKGLAGLSSLFRQPPSGRRAVVDVGVFHLMTKKYVVGLLRASDLPSPPAYLFFFLARSQK